MINKMLIVAVLVLSLSSVSAYVNADELEMQSKGGVLYPITGDSTQDIFHTPPNIKDYLHPGMFLGVLPEDCMSASHGEIGDYYICHYDLALKPTVHGGRAAYEVIEVD